MPACIIGGSLRIHTMFNLIIILYSTEGNCTMVKAALHLRKTLILITLVQLVHCSVYYVQSVDDINNQSCMQHQRCNKLDYYLTNETNIFSSNVKVYFNAGTHYLEKMLVIKNTYNLSLLGMTSNGSFTSAQIVCTDNFKTAGMVLVNTTNTVIHNLVFTNCNANGESLFYVPPQKTYVFDSNLTPLPVHTASLIAVDCTDLQLQKITVNSGHSATGLLCVNIWGSSHFESLYSAGLEVYYTRTLASNKTIVLTINQYQPLDLSNNDFKQLFQILAFKCASRLRIILSNIMFINSHSINIGLKHTPRITVIFDQCLFANANDQKVIINFPPKEGLPSNFINLIQFANCEFKYNYHATVIMIFINNTAVSNCQVDIINCTFKENSYSTLIKIETLLELIYSFRIAATLFMQNVTIKDIGCYDYVISLENVLLQMKGVISFINIQSADKTGCNGILHCTQSQVVVHKYLVFFQNNYILNLISFQDTYYIKMMEGSVFNITNNVVKHYIFRMIQTFDYSNFLLCFFQYHSEQRVNAKNYSVTIYNNEFTKVFGRDVKLVHCAWLDDSAFDSSPYDVNSEIIHLVNSSGRYAIQKDIKQLCYCTNDTHYDCSIDELGPIYPGQTLSTKFAFVWSNFQTYVDEGSYYIQSDIDESYVTISNDFIKAFIYFETNGEIFPAENSMIGFELMLIYFSDSMHEYQNVTTDISHDAMDFIFSYLNGKLNRPNNTTVSIDYLQEMLFSVVNEVSSNECSVVLSKEKIQQIRNSQCTSVNFTILANGTDTCELYLMKCPKYFSPKTFDGFFVKLHSCPTGFILDELNGCICDPTLTSSPLSIKSCDINQQTILRPANSWILGSSASSMNDSHEYLVSAHCPFDYCIPHSSHLNLSSPHLQCQFNRTGLLCGKCHPSLSAVFGSSQCQHCSNIYLLIVIPLAVTGVLLAFLLFFLNLTITDGDIVPFIFYANIVSINSAIFFPQSSSNNPSYVFISLANLDLGIDVCFYDGMDEYAKMWLQLLYPSYLICIASTLIVASRYISKVQQLTAHRALPVLATLFMLSYTKILRMVCSVVFAYTKLTQLPSLKATVVWSVDANVTLFGVKFAILFIACIVIFLLLIPFSVILTFTRLLSRFKIVQRFKPLIDAFQGPYKTGYYYWPGLQVIMRAIFFGLSALEKNINLTLSITMLVTAGYFHGLFSVYKSNYKNYNELLMLLNMVALFAACTQGNSSIVVVNALILLAAIQFCLIVTYHIINFAHNGWIINKLEPWVDKYKGRLRIGGGIHNNIILHNVNAPDVTYNYTEFREPLAGHDF